MLGLRRTFERGAMDLSTIIDFFVHLDHHLAALIADYGNWIYAILFFIIFAETGLVVTPFLPGDSLLFALGALAAGGALSLPILFILLVCAAILGNTVNYGIGYALGPKVFHYENSRLLNKKHLERTHAFYQKHGGKTLIIARFLPIFRTFAPFVAGIGRMDWMRFSLFNISGALLWISLLLGAGYLFGNMPIVKDNFGHVILGIILVSLLPVVIELIRAKRAT